MECLFCENPFEVLVLRGYVERILKNNFVPNPTYVKFFQIFERESP